MPRQSNSTEEYLDNLQNAPVMATNEYEHRGVMLDSTKNEKKTAELMPEREFLMAYSDMIDKDIQTANIGTDELAFLILKEAEIITHILDMASREPALRPVFLVMYNRFRNGILITKAKGGAWANKQFATGISSVQIGSYGLDNLRQQEQQQQGQENTNPLQKLMQSFKTR